MKLNSPLEVKLLLQLFTVVVADSWIVDTLACRLKHARKLTNRCEE